MKEIRIHGRGGQGSLVLAQFLAIGAFKDGRYSQAFPFLGGGGERKGKPIQAFCRFDDRPIRLRSQVRHPDYVIVQDATLLQEVDVASDLKEGGLILVNSSRELPQLDLGNEVRVIPFPASRIAQEILGSPIANTALLGAFAAATDELTLEAICGAIKERLGGHLGEENARVARRSYVMVKEGP